MKVFVFINVEYYASGSMSVNHGFDLRHLAADADADLRLSICQNCLGEVVDQGLMKVGVWTMGLGALARGGLDQHHSVVEHRYVNRPFTAEDVHRVLWLACGMRDRQRAAHSTIKFEECDRGVFDLTVKQHIRG